MIFHYALMAALLTSFIGSSPAYSGNPVSTACKDIFFTKKPTNSFPNNKVLIETAETVNAELPEAAKKIKELREKEKKLGSLSPAEKKQLSDLDREMSEQLRYRDALSERIQRGNTDTTPTIKQRSQDAFDRYKNEVDAQRKTNMDGSRGDGFRPGGKEALLSRRSGLQDALKNAHDDYRSAKSGPAAKEALKRVREAELNLQALGLAMGKLGL